MDGLAGVTARDTNTAGVTVNVVLSLIIVAGSIAVMVTLPTATLLARPSLPEALLIAATPVSDELQVTEVVMSWVLVSE